MKDSLTKAVDQIMVNAATKAYEAKAKSEDATSGQQLAATPSEVTLTAEQLGKPAVAPFSHRELKTTAELLKLRIENMIRDFERDTGTKIDSVRYSYYDTSVSMSVKTTEPGEHGLHFFYV